MEFATPAEIPDQLLPIAAASPIHKHPWLNRVVHLQPVFRAWPAGLPRPRDTKGNKPLAEFAGRATFAEIAILRAFEQAGWEGRWIDNYPLPPTFRSDYWDEAGERLTRERANRPLPPHILELYRSICTMAADERGGGAWDIIAWRGSEVAFAEAKRRRSSDWIRDPQVRWLEAAQALGVTKESMLFVEWSLL